MITEAQLFGLLEAYEGAGLVRQLVQQLVQIIEDERQEAYEAGHEAGYEFCRDSQDEG